jgi:hypothetical protein
MTTKRNASPPDESSELTAADALGMLADIERSLDVFVDTSSQAVEALGGRDAMASLCEMTCIGAVPRLDATAWQLMSNEYKERQRQLEAASNMLAYVPKPT